MVLLSVYMYGFFIFILQVKSQSGTDSNDFYMVTLDNGNGMPSCGCHDWTWQLLPCKHIFAVFMNSSNVSWTSLPETYRCSPFFTLDQYVVHVPVSVGVGTLEDPVECVNSDSEQQDGHNTGTSA